MQQQSILLREDANGATDIIQPSSLSTLTTTTTTRSKQKKLYPPEDVFLNLEKEHMKEQEALTKQLKMILEEYKKLKVESNENLLTIKLQNSKIHEISKKKSDLEVTVNSQINLIEKQGDEIYELKRKIHEMSQNK
jgi:hypothetical protein